MKLLLDQNDVLIPLLSCRFAQFPFHGKRNERRRRTHRSITSLYSSGQSFELLHLRFQGGRALSRNMDTKRSFFQWNVVDLTVFKTRDFVSKPSLFSEVRNASLATTDRSNFLLFQVLWPQNVSVVLVTWIINVSKWNIHRMKRCITHVHIRVREMDAMLCLVWRSPSSQFWSPRFSQWSSSNLCTIRIFFLHIPFSFPRRSFSFLIHWLLLDLVL